MLKLSAFCPGGPFLTLEISTSRRTVGPLLEHEVAIELSDDDDGGGGDDDETAIAAAVDTVVVAGLVVAQ